MQPDVAALTQEWLQLAADDLAFAQQGDPVFARQVCFFTQQAIEKALKALLTHNQ